MPVRPEGSPSRRRRDALQRRPSLEPMEGRLLLSGTGAAMAARPIMRPSDGADLSGHPALEARRALTSARALAARDRAAAYAAEHSGDPRTVGNGIDFTTDTISTGKKLATSGSVFDTGVDFAKTSVSHDTTKVGWEYVKAVARADGKSLHALGKSSLVKKVGNDFAALAHSDAVKKIGNSFSSFGQAVSKNFHKIF